MTSTSVDNLQAVLNALYYIDPDIERTEWVSICFALVAEFGRDEGGDLFIEWSQCGKSYDSAAAEAVIRSADPHGAVKIGTLFHVAKQFGYRPEAGISERVFDPMAEHRSDRAGKWQPEGLTLIPRNTTATAKAVWSAATQASHNHPYLRRKQVTPPSTLREISMKKLLNIIGYIPRCDDLRLSGDMVLVAPIVQIRNGERVISNVELIDASGSKAALAGRGTKAAGFWAACKMPDGDGTGVTLLIAEGVATAISAYQATEHPTVASLSSSNITAVTKLMREQYPAALLTVLADIGNGQADAERAAQAVGARIVVPLLPQGSKGKDFNDMQVAYHHDGLTMVKQQINAADTESAWPAPDPIEDGLPPVPAFDYTMLPLKVRAYVQDTAERMQCPPDYVAVSMMVALGSVIGRRVGVRPKREDNWTEYGNLWGMLIGRPSMKKSPAMAAGFAGLYKLEKKAAANYARDIEQYRQAQVLAELRNKQIKQNIQSALKKDLNAAADVRLDEPVKPVLMRYTSNNFSPEAVVEVLRHNSNGLLCWEDELIGLIKRWSKEGQEDSRGLFLQGWSGKMPYTTDRIGRGMNLHVSAVCLSVFGTTQPGVIADFVRGAVKGGASDDGLIQRFGLMVYPDKCDESEIQFIDQRPDHEAQLEMETMFESIAEAKPLDFGAEHDEHDNTSYLRLDGDAYVLFREWNIQNERRLQSGDLHPVMESHLSKYNKLVLGLALICHIASGGKGAISEVAMLQALSWLEYLEPHAHRVFFGKNNVKTEAAKSLQRRIHNGDLVDGFTARDVYRKAWAYLSTQEDAQLAIDLLVGHGYLRADKERAAGRPTVRYLINPRWTS
jgi:putative DNA primase/helicase